MIITKFPCMYIIVYTYLISKSSYLKFLTLPVLLTICTRSSYVSVGLWSWSEKYPGLIGKWHKCNFRAPFPLSSYRTRFPSIRDRVWKLYLVAVIVDFFLLNVPHNTIDRVSAIGQERHLYRIFGLVPTPRSREFLYTWRVSVE